MPDEEFLRIRHANVSTPPCTNDITQLLLHSRINQGSQIPQGIDNLTAFKHADNPAQEAFS